MDQIVSLVFLSNTLRTEVFVQHAKFIFVLHFRSFLAMYYPHCANVDPMDYIPQMYSPVSGQKHKVFNLITN